MNTINWNAELEKLKKPWTPYAVFAGLHFLIMAGEVRKYLNGNLDGLLAGPIIVCAFGGIWDNIRLFYGAKMGEKSLSMAVTNIRYVIRMALIPTLFIPISHMIGQFISFTLVYVIGRIASVAFFVHGFNEFIIQVAGNYVIVKEYDVTRHTVDPQMRNKSIRLPSVIVGFGGVVAGLSAMATHGVSLVLAIQLACLLGRFAVPVYPQLALLLSRGLEVTFLGTLVYLQSIAV